jgi:hypothetical protein
MTTSPYLLRPLRNLAQAMEDIEQRRRRGLTARVTALLEGSRPATAVDAAVDSNVAPATPEERRRLIRLVS